MILRKSADGSYFAAFPGDYHEGAAGLALGIAVEPGSEYVVSSSRGLRVAQL